MPYPSYPGRANFPTFLSKTWLSLSAESTLACVYCKKELIPLPKPKADNSTCTDFCLSRLDLLGGSLFQLSQLFVFLCNSARQVLERNVGSWPSFLPAFKLKRRLLIITESPLVHFSFISFCLQVNY